MAKAEDNYGKALFELGVPDSEIRESQTILRENPNLFDVLCNPTVTRKQKHHIVDAVFPYQARNFLKVLCDNGKAESLPEIYTAYKRCCLENDNVLEAEFIYVNEPSEEQLAALKQKLKDLYNKSGVKLIRRQDPSLIGGFLCRVGDVEYDYSVKGRLRRLHRKLVRG